MFLSLCTEESEHLRRSKPELKRQSGRYRLDLTESGVKSITKIRSTSSSDAKARHHGPKGVLAHIKEKLVHTLSETAEHVTESAKSGPGLNMFKHEIKDKNEAVLVVKVIKARKLLAKDSNGSSDPYAILRLNGIKHKTTIVKKCLKPLWDETFTFTGELFCVTMFPNDK